MQQEITISLSPEEAANELLLRQSVASILLLDLKSISGIQIL